jgi:hypothetical protein
MRPVWMATSMGWAGRARSRAAPGRLVVMWVTSIVEASRSVVGIRAFTVVVLSCVQWILGVSSWTVSEKLV